MLFRSTLDAPYFPIGVAEFIAPFEVTNRGFATASWFETLACDAQKVVIESNGYFTRYTVNGTITNAYFGSSWGGVAIGTYDKARDVGRMTTYTYVLYDYNFAKQLIGDEFENMIVTLMPEYWADSAPYKHDPSKTSYFLCVSDEGHPLEVKRIAYVAFERTHTYMVTFRGQLQENVLVDERDGFNRNTKQVAINRAIAKLELIPA